MSKIALILGAGASRPYGLPTSGELRSILLGGSEGDEVLRNLGISFHRVFDFLTAVGNEKWLGSQDRSYLEALNKAYSWAEIPKGLSIAKSFVDSALTRLNIRQPAIDHFREIFFQSQRISIDAFIARYDDFSWPARCAVAAILLLCEREPRLDGDWYQQLLEHLIGNGLNTRDYGIINFNYDRSFLWYFRRAFLAHYPNSSKDAATAIRDLQLVTPYGFLGPCEAYGYDQNRAVPYGSLQHYQNAASNLRLAGSPRSDGEKSVLEILADAERIIFLGFGFWKENVALLQIPNNHPSIVASAFRLPATVRGDMETQLNVRFGDSNQKILDYVMNEPVFRI